MNAVREGLAFTLVALGFAGLRVLVIRRRALRLLTEIREALPRLSTPGRPPAGVAC